MTDELEILAVDSINQFGTANIHTILKLHFSSGTDKLKQAVADFLECNGGSSSHSALIIGKFESLFRDPESLLAYILHNKVRPYYFTLDESPVLRSLETIGQLKEEIAVLSKKLNSRELDLSSVFQEQEALRAKLAETENELKVKTGEVLQKQGQIEVLENKLSKYKLETSKRDSLKKEINDTTEMVQKNLAQKEIELKGQQETINYQRHKIDKLKTEVRNKDQKLRSVRESCNRDAMHINHLVEELKSERAAHENTKRIVQIKNQELNQKDEENERLRHYSRELNRALDRFKPVYHQPA